MYPSEKDREYFFRLLNKYNEGVASPEERAFVEQYLHMLNYRSPDILADFEQEKDAIEKDIHNRLLAGIQQAVPPSGLPVAMHRVPLHRRRAWWAAASLLLLIAAGSFLIFRSSPSRQDGPAVFADINAGKEGAILTLSDGSQVVLDSMGNGLIALQSGSRVKLVDRQLQYEQNAAPSSPVIAYNTMTIPRGRQYRLLLPDGTRVWLNAASSITYPTAFSGPERRVRITGEAYFEVAHNKRKPFKVTVNDRTFIEVLGTHFNINAYSDENGINTTLLEGSVKVIANNSTQMLAPGQQARIDGRTAAISLIPDANTGESIAWKDGRFAFADADLPAVMRKLSRWYDIEVEYRGNIPQDKFSGEIDRSLSLSQVLKGLASTRINYTIEGRKLIILP